MFLALWVQHSSTALANVTAHTCIYTQAQQHGIPCLVMLEHRGRAVPDGLRPCEEQMVPLQVGAT
jgi:hypothetical protein